MKMISFTEASISKKILNKLIDLEKYNNYSTDGLYSKKCSIFFEKTFNINKVLMTKSCTSALEMCAILINIKKDDEVIFPSYGYVSTVNAFVLRGARPIFVDVNSDNISIDVNQIEKKITKKTKAVVITNYAGGSCDIDKIIKLKRKYNFYLIEDAAQSIFSKYKNKYLGTIGDLSTMSFHQTKNIHCGEGGALFINNKKFIERAVSVLKKGTNKQKFLEKKIKKYSWIDLGSSFEMSEIHAYILFQSLKQWKKDFTQRMKIWKNYHDKLHILEKKNLLRRPRFFKSVKHNAHMYYILVKRSYRDKIINYLNKNKIGATFHYLPLHESYFFRRNFKKNFNLKVSNDIANKIVRLPISHNLKKKQFDHIIKHLFRFFKL